MITATQPSKATANGRVLVVVAVLVASLVCGLGWFTQLRSVMYGALLLALAGALLPFLLLVALIALVAVAALVAALTGGGDLHVGAPDASGIAEGFSRLTRGYYRALAKQRSPWFWGIPLGVVLGVFSLWAALAVWVVPRETQTMKILASAQEEIETAQRATGKYPAPDAEGRYLRRGSALSDGFGRPLHYQVTGRWLLSSYVIRSWGFDARPGNDDLCVEGGGALRGVSRAADALARGLEGKPDAASLRAWLSAVQAARCSAND